MANDPKNFRIPKEFTLFGSRYVVVMEDELLNKESCYGTADDDTKTIRLQKKGSVIRLHKDEETGELKPTPMEIEDSVVVETFYHELCHIILDALGECKLSKNEKLINMLGKSLLEVYLSSVYEEENK